MEYHTSSVVEALLIYASLFLFICRSFYEQSFYLHNFVRKSCMSTAQLIPLISGTWYPYSLQTSVLDTGHPAGHPQMLLHISQ